LRDHNLRPAVNVGRRETQHLESGVDNAVLSAVVLDKPFPMVAAVVLEHKPL
jgi:hypothetical protein